MIPKILFSFAVVLSVLSTIALGITKMRAKEPVLVTIIFDKTENPLREGFANVEIKNNTDKEMEIWSNLHTGTKSYLDASLLDSTNTRISTAFYWCSIASPFLDAKLTSVIPAGKSIIVPIKLFDGVDGAVIKPGKYKCQIRFKYDDLKLDSSTDEIEFDITPGHIEKRDK